MVGQAKVGGGGVGIGNENTQQDISEKSFKLCSILDYFHGVVTDKLSGYRM